MLKVGELAKRTGLTVRTLHHYDEIGLLAPSARSDAGYRLYTEEDIVRLHAIQALRQLGLSLADIAELLARPDVSLAGVIRQQRRALDEEIERAQQLRGRLDALALAIDAGTPPAMGEWLDTLELMATYGKYFSNDELARIFRNWKQVQADWPPLLETVRDAMERKVLPDSYEAQVLAQRWMDLSMAAMQNDIGLAMRWGDMTEREPATPGPGGIEPALIRYIGQAIGLRMAAFQRHLSREDLARLDKSLAPDWAGLADRARLLMQKSAAPDSKEARALAVDWEALLDRVTGNDPGLRLRFTAAYREEPLLRMGHVITEEVRNFIERIGKDKNP